MWTNETDAMNDPYRFPLLHLGNGLDVCCVGEAGIVVADWSKQRLVTSIRMSAQPADMGKMRRLGLIQY